MAPRELTLTAIPGSTFASKNSSSLVLDDVHVAMKSEGIRLKRSHPSPLWSTYLQLSPTTNLVTFLDTFLILGSVRVTH